MRTVFGKLKKEKSGQAVKPTTAQQQWTLRCFKFLEAHMTIRTDTRQLGKVVLPAEVEEEGGDNDDAASLGSTRSSRQLPSASQPSTSQDDLSQPMTGGPGQRAALARGSTRPS